MTIPSIRIDFYSGPQSVGDGLETTTRVASAGLCGLTEHDVLLHSAAPDRPVQPGLLPGQSFVTNQFLVGPAPVTGDHASAVGHESQEINGMHSLLLATI